MMTTDSSSSSTAYIQTSKTFFLVIAIILASFYLLSAVLLPIIISFTLYALLQPFTHYLVRHNVNHSLAIILILILMLGISVIAIRVALPALFAQVAIIKTKLPLIIDQLEHLITLSSQRLGDYMGIELDLSNIAVSVLAQSSSFGNKLLVSISEQVFAITLGMILVPVLTYFILKDFKSLRNRMLNWLPNARFELGWLIYHRVTHQLQSYTRGVMIQSLIMALVASLGFTLIGLEIPLLIGILTGLLNLIPYIGPLISMMLASLVAATMTPFEPNLIYLSIGVVLTAQIIDNLLVIPYVIAGAVDLHPVPVIVGLIIFGSLFGAIGVILAIPAMATAKIIFTNLYSDIYNASQTSLTEAH